MGHPFEQRSHAEVPASPDEVWAAIASGLAGTSAWLRCSNGWPIRTPRFPRPCWLWWLW